MALYCITLTSDFTGTLFLCPGWYITEPPAFPILPLLFLSTKFFPSVILPSLLPVQVRGGVTACIPLLPAGPVYGGLTTFTDRRHRVPAGAHSAPQAKGFRHTVNKITLIDFVVPTEIFVF